MATRFQITFDCRNPDALAAFWADALGYNMQPPPEGFVDWPSFLADIGLSDRIGQNSAVVDAEGVGPRIFFQQVSEEKLMKNRLHFDLNVSGGGQAGSEEGKRRIATEAERLIRLGARKLRDFDGAGEFWTVMADPEGNEFCLQ